jgi:uncharacterized protein YgiM (DUF1202 family)
MKNKIKGCLLLIIVILVVQGLLYAQTNTEIIKVKGANFRDGPSAKSKVIGKITKGEEVEILDVSESGSWYRVLYKGAEGWLHESTVTNKRVREELIRNINEAPQMPPKIYTEKARVLQSRPTIIGESNVKWRSITNAADIDYQINDAGIRNRGEFISLWVRKYRKGSVNELHSYDINCRTDLSRYRGKIEYGSDGRVADTEYYPESKAKFVGIISGTAIEKIKEEACAVDAGKPTSDPLFPFLPKPPPPPPPPSRPPPSSEPPPPPPPPKHRF